MIIRYWQTLSRANNENQDLRYVRIEFLTPSRAREDRNLKLVENFADYLIVAPSFLSSSQNFGHDFTTTFASRICSLGLRIANGANAIAMR